MLIDTIIRILAAATAIGLVYRYSSIDRDGPRGDPFRTNYLLVSLVAVSASLHFQFAVTLPPAALVHSHDIFHYYMGSKYSPEVGYLDLYNCAVVADQETSDGDVPRYGVRRMDDYEFSDSRQVLADAARYRALFTDERWEEFRSDIAAFRASMESEERFRAVFKDNGYNATPVWNRVAHWISNRVSVQGRMGLPLLASLDAALLVLMFVVVGRTFGWRTSAIAAIFVGTMFPMAAGTIRGAFLRLDWLSLLVMLTCALKVKRYKTAGALAAYAGMARIFPLVFVFGLGAKWVWDLARSRTLNRRYLEFFVVFALVVVALFALSIVADGGTDTWHAFWTKIQFHDTNMSGLRAGFKPLLLASAATVIADWPSHPTARALRFDEVRTAWWAVLALVSAGCFVGARRLEDYETVSLGYVLVFFLAAPTYYYHVMLVSVALLFLPKLAERPRAHGMALLFGTSIAGLFLWGLDNLGPITEGRQWARYDYGLVLAFSGMLLVVALYVLGLSLGIGRESRSAGPVEPAS